MAAKKKKIDVLLHDLVPQHLILTKEEMARLMNEYSVDLVHFPKILMDDPAIMALGAKVGDVIKIIRKIPKESTAVAESSINYRVVVPRRMT